ncbi:probable carboxylesterase 6 [Lactuca sativa]|uniref:probable carboxylesterase 6 n=1 Tax=Lactuca sativa TaxID=4236 RepID=UPI000CD9BDDE|nr:probable carboxylesterase 6 [Lactuca sativa]
MINQPPFHINCNHHSIYTKTLHFLTTTTTMEPTIIVTSDFIKAYSDGTIERFIPETSPASLDLYDGYKCKDVTIDPSKPITARLFIPTAAVMPPSLPIVVYFHGGGFAIGSTTWLGYHHFLGDLSAATKSIVLSVDYRLAPENRLPIAYEDSYASLVWLYKQKPSDSWLQDADLSRVFLSGDSAGGNIAHQVAIRAIRDTQCPVRVSGILSIHPYFGSEKRTELETKVESADDVKSNDMFWSLSVPKGSNRDYDGCNLEKMVVSMSEWNRFPDVLVFVAEFDFLKERGVEYAEFLKGKGVKVELIETKDEKHVFHVFRPDSEETKLLQSQMNEFIHSF